MRRAQDVALRNAAALSAARAGAGGATVPSSGSSGSSGGKPRLGHCLLAAGQAETQGIHPLAALAHQIAALSTDPLASIAGLQAQAEALQRTAAAVMAAFPFAGEWRRRSGHRPLVEMMQEDGTGVKRRQCIRIE